MIAMTVLSLHAWSQQSFRGVVTDETDLPIPGAYVLLEGTDYYATTDSDGSFEFYGIPQDTYTLMIQYIGYETYKTSINLVETKYVKVKLEEALKLEEVILNTSVNAQAQAFNVQKNADHMVQLISGEQVEKYPDANIGDALKRISGINVQYDQGEARFANIRGTAPELNAITVNGDRIPSAEAEKRYVQLDLIPSDMIDNIEVFKAVTPDMDADAIGGAINLETQKVQAKQVIKGTIGSGYSVLTQKPIYKGKLSYSNRFKDNKIGLNLEASILDKQTRSDNLEPSWDYLDENNKDATAFTEELQVRQYYVERLRKSFAAKLDFDLNRNHNLFISGMYNHRNDWENRYRLEYKDIEQDGSQWIAEIRRQTKGGGSDQKDARLEDQRVISFQAGGDHYLNSVHMDWSFSSMKASEERPHERYITMREKDADVNVDFSDTQSPVVNPVDSELQDLSNEFSLKELSEEFQLAEEKDINFRFNVEFPLMTGKNAGSLKLGTRMKLKDKEMDKDFYEYEPLDEDAFDMEAVAQGIDQSQSNFNAGDYSAGSFVDAAYLGALDLTNVSQFEESIVYDEMIGNYTASEDVYAGYLMYTQNIGEKLTFIGGVRLENTQLINQGKNYNDIDDELVDSPENKADYTNILPGFHLKFSPSNSTNFRFAFTNTLARPNYYDVVPYVNKKIDDNELEMGNPDLAGTPTKSINFDLLGEHFFSNVGILSAGVFYKNLSDVIATRVKKDYMYDGNQWDKFIQPFNVGDATLYGFEIGIQRRLDFLPGILNKMNISTNYTYNKSKLKEVQLQDREDEKLTLSGTPENLFNASLAYDSKKVEMRISYSFADDFIEEYHDEEAFYDRWYDKVQYLDINAEYKFHKNWKVYVSLENLLNQPLRYYQGIESRTMQAEYYGINTKLGLKFKF